MNVFDYAKLIVLGDSLEDKLTSPNLVEDMSCTNSVPHIDFSMPSRSKKITFSERTVRFPKTNTLGNDDMKGTALHFFANHELLAIEIMAAAILQLAGNEFEGREKLLQGILKTISDEQKHFKLYLRQIQEFGMDFGDIPNNIFFWKQFLKVKSWEEYFALVSLTFEGANLDFALYYASIFKHYGDDKCAQIMHTIHQDEISHVAFGVSYLNKKADGKLWDYYNSLLPEQVTPARAKGVGFDTAGRIKAGMDMDFIQELKSYKDPFQVTNRRNKFGKI